MTGLSKPKLALYLAAIFAAGAVSGWFVGTRSARSAARTPPSWDEFSRYYREKVIGKLDLAENQKREIDAILKKSSADMESSHRQNLARINSARSNRNAQVMAVLSPEQRVQYLGLQKAYEKERRDRGTNFMRGRPPGPERDRPHGEGPRDRRDRERTNPPANSAVTNLPSNGQDPQQR